MSNPGPPREPRHPGGSSERPHYDWLYEQSQSPRRPPGRRPRAARAGGPDDPTQVVRTPPAGGYPGDQPGRDPYAADPYAARDPYGSADPYAQHDPYARRDPYGQRDPYAQRDPYGQRDPYAQHDPYGYGHDPWHGGQGRRPYAADPAPTAVIGTYGGDDRGEPPSRQRPGRPSTVPGGPPPRGRRRPRIRWLRVVLLLLFAYLVFLVAIPFLAWNRIDKVAFEPTGERAAEGSGTNFLLVGSDSREGLTPEERNELHTGDAGGRRTDTIMLLHVPGNGRPPTLVSIPRDSYVPIPGHDRNKINAAFAFGGPQLLAETVENVTGLRIDGYVEVGFGGFVGVVEALDGVEMCLPSAIQDDKAHIDLPAGCQVLDGPSALGYVRARYFDPKGDIGRVERQRQFLAAVMKETLSPSTVFHPIRYPRVSLTIGESLTVGEGTGIIDMAKFGLAMRSISSGSGTTLTVPIADPGYSTPVGSAVKWDTDDALELFHALRDDQPVPPSLLPDAEDSGS